MTEPSCARLRWLLIAAIAALLARNALRVDPRIGYDALGHLAYAEVLAERGRLPNVAESHEFFSPPLPYLAPAVGYRLGLDGGKLGQWAQLLVWLLVCWRLPTLCRRLQPAAPERCALLALLALALMPFTFKSVAMVRGEPYVALFTVLALELALRLREPDAPRWRTALLLGLSVAGLGLARQWGALVGPALLLLLGSSVIQRLPRAPRDAGGLLAASALAALIGLAGCGWFYLGLRAQHGKLTAFNREGAPAFALTNQPPHFYRDLAREQLFERPIRPAFPNRMLPILHSEVWGDYWCYWLVTGRDRRSGHHVDGLALERTLRFVGRPPWLDVNDREMAPYLARLNALGLLPTLLAALALLAALRPPPSARAAHAALAVAIVGSLLGYLTFLIAYPDPGKGDTIKATYMLHTAPLFAALIASALCRCGRRWQLLLSGALFLLWLHNLPACIGRYT